jgi:hypothetical protein
MTLVVLLLAALQSPPAFEKPREWDVRFGPTVEYWFPRFSGDFRENGGLSKGSTLHLEDDLNLRTKRQSSCTGEE